MQVYKLRGIMQLITGKEIFYRSVVYKDMREGISDMHCRSDAYLAQELRDEYNKKSR